MAAVSMMTFGLVGCGSNSPQSADAAEQGKNVESVELNGTIKLAGSTSMEKLCEAMAESFMERNPGVTVTVEYTGSGAGLESLAAGSVDIGNASRDLKDEEKASGAVENIVAIDGIAVITNKSCSIKDVTSKNLAKIYSGEITDWAELGGKEQPIIVIGREAGSGTRDAFEELLEVKDGCVYAQELLNVPVIEEKNERSSADQRLIESFEEINQFFEEHRREPKVGADIGEFMLASRLQGIRNNPGKVKTLLPFDFNNLLKSDESQSITVEDILGDDPMNLLAGGDDEDDSIYSITHEVYNAVALCPNCHRKMHSLDEPADVAYLKKVAKH